MKKKARVHFPKKEKRLFRLKQSFLVHLQGLEPWAH